MYTQIILIALLVTGFTPVYAQGVGSSSQERGSLSGAVTDDRGKPLWGVKVKVEKVGGLFSSTVETSKEGRYELRDLEAGMYEVTVIAPSGLTLIDKYVVHIEPFRPTIHNFSAGLPQGPVAPVPPSEDISPDKKVIPPDKKKNKRPNNSEILYTVRQETVEDQISLNDWLRALEKEGRRFVPAVFPKAQGQCLIVLELLGTRQPIHHYVLSASGSDIRKQLEQKYNTIPDRIIIGTCEAQDGSYLIIIRDGKR